MESSDFVYNDIWDHAEKLERFFDRIISCQAVVSAPHRRRHQGKIYHVQVRLYVPGEDTFVNTEPEKNAAHEDVYVAIRDAFDAVRRKLEDHVRQMRGLKKETYGPALGKVARLFANEDYGFLVTQDNREIYFHKNSVLNHAFERLKIGDEVRFSEEMGEKGPQATSMTIKGRS
jgi:ribosomal subunit interface protein